MAHWEIIVLAVIQGLTEFLPVSSSGHLVVAHNLITALGGEPIEDLLEVEVVLHLGTLAAVLIYYRHECLRLFTSDRRAIPLLILATIPAVFVGFSIDRSLLENPLLAGMMFPVTAVGLLWISRRPAGESEYLDLKPRQALVIGLLQAFAILPGISRSGATIVGGLACGLKRESAAAFAFLMAIPVIGGGGLLTAVKAYKQGTTSTPPATLAIGFLVSLVVGWVALALLIHWVRQGKLAMFAYYLVPLGVAVVAWQLVG
jgi:undecaprenyl-diphosphatase